MTDTLDPEADPPSSVEMATKAGGKHPTGMHSCLYFQISGVLAAIFLIIILSFDIQGIKVISQEQPDSSYPADYLSPILKIVSIVSVNYYYLLIAIKVKTIKYIVQLPSIDNFLVVFVPKADIFTTNVSLRMIRFS